MNNKDSFKYWVSKNLAKNSNAGSSYITSLDWLSKRFFEKGRIRRKLQNPFHPDPSLKTYPDGCFQGSTCRNVHMLPFRHTDPTRVPKVFPF